MPNENLRTDLTAVLVMAASSVLKCYPRWEFAILSPKMYVLA